MDEVTDNNQVNTVIDQSAGGGSISADHGINYFVLRTLTLLCVTFYVVAFSGIITVKPLVFIFGILGYASLPLLAFCSVEAFRHSTRLNSLIIRNIILAVLCAFPYRFAFYSQKSFSDVRSYFSLALTCLFCIGSVMFYEKMKTKTQKMFCVAFLCAISLLIGMDFAPYMPIISFVILIYLKEQEGKDAKGIENKDQERIDAIARRKYLFSKYTFIKVTFFIATLAIIVPVVSAVFAAAVPGYSESFSDELLRNYCMPGMLLSLPLIRFYNGKKGIENRFTKIVFRSYYLLLLVLIVMIKIFFLFDYSAFSVSG